jgi:hypothetical protein
MSTVEKIDLPNAIPTSLEGFGGMRQVNLWTPHRSRTALWGTLLSSG